MSLRLASLAAVIGLCSACDPGTSRGNIDSDDGALRGCALDPASVPTSTPGGYYTNGASVCAADGTTHLFHGVDRPSFEWDPNGEGDSAGVPASDFRAMASWHANVVRIALNQDFWLSNAALYAPSYEATIGQAVLDAEAAGLDVILDLHWSDQGNAGVTNLGGAQDASTSSAQQRMADLNSKDFWTKVATKYKNDAHVLFELYNEPHDVNWDVWLNGGTAGGFRVVGMQELYDTVRATGASNLVILGGLSYAFDLSGVANNRVKGYNVMYATHPYRPQNAIGAWPTAFGYLASQDIAPVIATEFGDLTKNCTADWDNELVQFADAHRISWTAWAWWKGNCSFPALLSDWQYTPTEQGQAIKTALLAYPQ